MAEDFQEFDQPHESAAEDRPRQREMVYELPRTDEALADIQAQEDAPRGERPAPEAGPLGEDPEPGFLHPDEAHADNEPHPEGQAEAKPQSKRGPSSSSDSE